MGNYKNKAYPLRINDELKNKMKEIAKRGNRPVSREYETAITSYIKNYEEENGIIKIDINDTGGGQNE